MAREVALVAVGSGGSVAGACRVAAVGSGG